MSSFDVSSFDVSSLADVACNWTNNWINSLLALQMPIKISEREVKLLLEQALDYYVSYVIKNEFPHLTRDSYFEAAWIQMLINDGFRH